MRDRGFCHKRQMKIKTPPPPLPTTHLSFFSLLVVRRNSIKRYASHTGLLKTRYHFPPLRPLKEPENVKAEIELYHFISLNSQTHSLISMALSTMSKQTSPKCGVSAIPFLPDVSHFFHGICACVSCQLYF